MFFLVVGALRFNPPYTNGLVVHGQKVFFCLVVRGVYPPYTLSGPTLKKHFFLCVSSLKGAAKKRPLASPLSRGLYGHMSKNVSFFFRHLKILVFSKRTGIFKFFPQEQKITFSIRTPAPDVNPPPLYKTTWCPCGTVITLVTQRTHYNVSTLCQWFK